MDPSLLPIPEWFEIGPVLRVTFVPPPLTETPVAQSEVDGVPVNKRQQWFLYQLKQGIRCRPADIAAKWDVVEKTAKRDINYLQKKNLIDFIGPLKTGTYQLK
jgi:hypothetical protein